MREKGGKERATKKRSRCVVESQSCADLASGSSRESRFSQRVEMMLS